MEGELETVNCEANMSHSSGLLIVRTLGTAFFWRNLTPKMEKVYERYDKTDFD
jgi:hypothetical protein